MTSTRDRSVLLRMTSRTVDADAMPPQQPTPRPLGQKDAAVLIGLLAVIESELAGKNVEPYLVKALIRRFQHEGLIPKKAGSPDLRAVLAQLNQRLRVAHGEPIELGELTAVEEEPDDDVVPPAAVQGAPPGQSAAAEPVEVVEPAATIEVVEAIDPVLPEPAPEPVDALVAETPRHDPEEPGVAGAPTARHLWRKPKISE